MKEEDIRSILTKYFLRYPLDDPYEEEIRINRIVDEVHSDRNKNSR